MIDTKIILKQDIQAQKTEISNLHVPLLLFISNGAMFEMGWCNALKKKKKSNVSYVLRGPHTEAPNAETI